MADFEIDLKPLVDKAGDNARKFVIAFALALTMAVQENTPVLTGRLRSSIRPAEPLESWQPGDDIVIGTNVVYARRIEYGFQGEDSLGRKYHEVGRGMFAQAAADAPSIAERVLDEVSNG